MFTLACVFVALQSGQPVWNKGEGRVSGESSQLPETTEVQGYLLHVTLYAGHNRGTVNSVVSLPRAGYSDRRDTGGN